MAQNGNFIRDIVDISKRWVERKKGTSTTWKCTLRESISCFLMIVVFSCVVKAKCYRSMRKAEAPQKLKDLYLIIAKEDVRKLPLSVHIKLELETPAFNCTVYPRNFFLTCFVYRIRGQNLLKPRPDWSPLGVTKSLSYAQMVSFRG